MKVIVRSLLFSYFIVSFITVHLDTVVIGGDFYISVFLLSLGLGVVNMFVNPVLRLVSLPDEGFFAFIINFFINFVSFYFLDSFLSFFSLTSGVSDGLNLSIFVIDSLNPSIFWSYAVSSGIYSAGFRFLSWLCTTRK